MKDIRRKNGNVVYLNMLLKNFSFYIKRENLHLKTA